MHNQQLQNMEEKTVKALMREQRYVHLCLEDGLSTKFLKMKNARKIKPLENGLNLQKDIVMILNHFMVGYVMVSTNS